jgi:hypothetical protein
MGKVLSARPKLAVIDTGNTHLSKKFVNCLYPAVLVLKSV